ncbi:urease subunit gamma [Streptomyces sp. KM273126]|uniref:urease subunit gamma n=1 Tax=Streptomyces sp. KM273126 TaxID=2545247 RepID=UPI00103D512A|nr:urease subunit gamma [Streptomyces sp. KM273126]MBA2811197.1 urease subunit gamma [Streptomyces sp. KM273126]
MHFSPHEQERLLVHVAAGVARQRREQGIKLNYPEAVALLTAYVYDQARIGRSVGEIMDSGRGVLTRDDVMDGVPEMIDNVQVETTFPDGTKLVTIHDPFDAPRGEVELHPGKVDFVDESVPLNPESGVSEIEVHNPTDRPVQVGSHYHFFEVNEGLEFDRKQAYGKRLNVAAGTSERFEPGDRRTVELVRIEGERKVLGLRGQVGGPLKKRSPGRVGR